MRITSGRMIDIAAAATARAQAQVADATEQLSSGVRVARPSQDPTAWVAGERAKVRRTVLDSQTMAVQSAKQRLVETDTALATLNEAVTRARELTVQGASESYSATDRAAIANQLRGLMVNAIDAANVKDSDGEFLLAGVASTTAPFDSAGNYSGDNATRSVASGVGTSIATVPGSLLTAASGVDVLPLFERAAALIAANDAAGAAALLGDFETAGRQVANARMRAGSAMSVLDDTELAHVQLSDHLSADIAKHVESDSVTAASELARASNALEISRAISQHITQLVAPR